MAMEKSDIIYDIQLDAWKGKKVRFELHEGLIRTGVVTRFEGETIDYDGPGGKRKLFQLKLIVLDNDITASIDLRTVKNIKFLG